MVEIVVACVLLASVISASTSLIVRHGRLLADHRDYQRGLEEVSNHMERLSSLPVAEIPAALEKLAPSPFAQEVLPGAELRGELEPSELGQRLRLQLTWEGRRDRPLCLTAWVYAASSSVKEPQPKRAP